MRTIIYKRTSSEWYPSINSTAGTLVSVQFAPLGPIHSQWRVCAWGDDDFGLEKDFDDKECAWECFLGLIGLEDLTHESLLQRGFVPA